MPLVMGSLESDESSNQGPITMTHNWLCTTLYLKALPTGDIVPWAKNAGPKCAYKAKDGAEPRAAPWTAKVL
jgi:hypothetical protein